MRLDASAWANPGEASGRLRCPGCGAGLPHDALGAGQRLTRCRQCGQMVRRAVRRNWPAAAFESFSGDRNYATIDEDAEVRLEVAPDYTYPALPCPYCEHINHDAPPIRVSGQQYCAHCGADLKKSCLNCDAPLYILDYYCTHCRSDQERVKYEVEALYWQHYNEGKRLADIGRWQDAERELSLFFNPHDDLDREHVRRARQIYVSSIAPFDSGHGLQVYNETMAQLRQVDESHARYMQRRKRQRWVWRAGFVVLLGIFSSIFLGSWWAVFVIVPLVALAFIILAFVLLAHLGLT